MSMYQRGAHHACSVLGLIKQAKQRTAVIIKGNPAHVASNPKADAFYKAIHAELKARGYAVSMDAGAAYTIPPAADLWVGHSRGVDRLRFAPQGTKTIAFGVHGGLSHPKDNSLHVEHRPSADFKPNKYHYVLTPAMRSKLHAV